MLDAQFSSTAKLHSGRYYTHPGYPGNEHDSLDIAVVVLDQPVKGITPARLPAAGLFDTMKAAGTLGLALWVTTPLFLFLPWARAKHSARIGVWLAALAVALPSLFYQNTGWVQFGYRFSNDFAPFLFAVLAVNGFVGRRLLYALSALAFVINAFGAKTFGRAEYARFYVTERTQRILYQPD